MKAGASGRAGDAGNLFAGIPASLPTELTDIISQQSGVRIERILSQGQRSPTDFWYDQDDNEFVLLLQGAARLEFMQPRRDLALAPGDYLLIPAGQRHRVAWTAADEVSIWLAVFFSPATSPEAGPGGGAAPVAEAPHPG